jgi:hypothetical protein
MARNETHGNFEDILVVATPELRSVCESLRCLIASLHKGFIEVVWPKQKIASFGVGPRKMTEHYAYIAVQGSHVNLGFYHGASLPDPKRLLEALARTCGTSSFATSRPLTAPRSRCCFGRPLLIVSATPARCSRGLPLMSNIRAR